MITQKQARLFDDADIVKTYRAIRHDVVRKKQNENCNTTHHPTAKAQQIVRTLDGLKGLKIIEFFAGRGNLTPYYKEHGDVIECDRKYLGTGDSYLLFHQLIAAKEKFNVVDLDPYGFPNRFFPDVFLLIDRGFLFVTMPKPSVNILNGITQAHLISYFGLHNPNSEQVINQIATWGICHWRRVELISCLDLKSVWRMSFSVEKVLATEYTGVKNK